MSTSSGQRGRGGAVGGQAEDEEDDDSSSTSSTKTLIEDELESFRNQWKLEVASNNDTVGSNFDEPIECESSDMAVEDQARMLFLEGVDHEQKGELFEAIRKYRKAVLLVPDIEFKAFEHTKRKRRAETPCEASSNDVASAAVKIVEVPGVDGGEVCGEVELSLEMAKLRLKSETCEREFPDAGAHISDLPPELALYILRWVVSAELDLRSLESFSLVCRGFYVLSRDADIWRRVCVETWGAAGVPVNEPAPGGWRRLYLSRPRVNLNGCYISRVTYLREGERGFQDNEFNKPWHVVQYYRLVRFFPGGRVVMITTAEEPSVAVKMLINRKSSCTIAGCLFGHYRSVNNRVVCVAPKAKVVTNNRFCGPKRKQKKVAAYYFEVPDQDFHFEFEIRGQRNQQLHWLSYSVSSKYKSGTVWFSHIDITNANNYPVLHFSRVKSYTAETHQPLP